LVLASHCFQFSIPYTCRKKWQGVPLKSRGIKRIKVGKTRSFTCTQRTHLGGLAMLCFDSRRGNAMNQRIALILLPLLVSGCASMAWSRPGTTEAQYYQDYSECEQRAAQMYQQQNSSYRTNCSTYGNQTNCTSRPSPGVGQIDLSISQRASAVESCLRGKGYRRGN